MFCSRHTLPHRRCVYSPIDILSLLIINYHLNHLIETFAVGAECEPSSCEQVESSFHTGCRLVFSAAHVIYIPTDQTLACPCSYYGRLSTHSLDAYIMEPKETLQMTRCGFLLVKASVMN